MLKCVEIATTGSAAKIGTLIRQNGKDNSMYILPECIAGIKTKRWKKCFNQTKKIPASLMLVVQQTWTCILK